ncbi:unnamed protein product [Microthlaspi erraticum]|uniref:KIB1-4 beta-propeller domain-containing protein n=1 Tax=Microthlaspi erraticum TaxID=1685480 RepID=A0A6D2IY59_9BRAS|nr:unnamed protein product [Microthlaspi erraticum]
MSQFFVARVSKLSSPLNRRLCSTAAASRPYLLLGKDVVGESPCGGKIVNLNLYDPGKEEQVTKKNQILPKNLCKSTRIGSSRGWLAMMKKRDSTVRLTNILDLDNSSKTISLPPLIKDETERLINVSVSSSSEKDCVVAARFYGSRLSLCRVGDSEWTRIDVPVPDFRFSPVMYSDRDSKFYLNSCSSEYAGPTTDFTSKSGLDSPVSGYVRYPLSELPELENHLLLQHLNVQQLLVQSPSGESFIVLWGVDCFTEEGEAVQWERNQEGIRIKTHTVMVFRQDSEKGICEYTEDIGDICIFVGHNEPFCLFASDYPGLKPNTVYFAGHSSGFGVCDLASRTLRSLSDSPRHRLFWLPPTTSTSH